MFFVVATDQLRQLVRRRSGTPHRSASNVALAASCVSPIDSALIDAPDGTRYQLLRALRALAKGEFMVVERRIPQVAEHLEDENGREAWFRDLRNPNHWQGLQQLEPILVPGTAYPGVIGRILLRSGWCAPCDTPHWVPNLRFFLITDTGRESFIRAQAWWSGLTCLQRLRVMLLE
ncbi:MAG: hypothetical protein K9J74_07605 [Sulfuritalea sp.]|nr:hypothetical protein [Sulfuritalea sp.]